MRRIVLAIVSTVAALVLLFSYRTSLPESVAASTRTSGTAHIVTQPGTAADATSSAAGGAADPGATGITIPTQTGSSSSTAGSTSRTATRAAIRTKSGSTAGSTSTPSSTSAKANPAPATTSGKAAAPQVVDGASADTQFGPVQVEVTVAGGKITSVKTIQYPNENPRDQEINSYAVPQLEQQAQSAQSAQIDGVSGATYTTEGFVTSLQSALDAAHFAA